MRRLGSEATLILVCTLCTVVLDAVTLFPYDSALPIAVIDDISEHVTLTGLYIFHGNKIEDIYISENGMVALEDGFYGGNTRPLTKSWIAPFGADIYPNAGEMKYQTFSSADIAETTKATELVTEIYPDSFQAAELFVVTWSDVTNSESSSKNTFQLALLSTSTGNTYAIFLYDKIEWYPAEIGISSGDITSFYRVCDTDKIGATFMHLKSNSQCATQGALVFRVDEGSWNSIGYTCTPVYTAITCRARPGKTITSKRCS